ncbi:hypothetical protein PISMIDRAFT_669978 [Pisolithus microcarpus 441]|uniref:Unplaced genomic scaffold scaffold_1, whole genome shotgun sequence n=1 Tax=Pisolithus microcarpus 441 TaxID=765257 RepID=A0A0D0AG38_9AGAM|nr:hypothetical protein PISMIDRAFT_669978 [Pisolithus microcarpus 441]
MESDVVKNERTWIDHREAGHSFESALAWHSGLTEFTSLDLYHSSHFPRSKATS